MFPPLPWAITTAPASLFHRHPPRGDGHAVRRPQPDLFEGHAQVRGGGGVGTLGEVDKGRLVQEHVGTYPQVGQEEKARESPAPTQETVRVPTRQDANPRGPRRTAVW